MRAIVADDDPFARRVIKTALQEHGIVVIAEAATGREALELTLHYGPDVVLLDIVMPELDGIATTERILLKRPEQLIVILTGSAEEDLAIRALRAGAVGYLTKDLDVDALPRALEGVLAGEAAISRGLARRLIEHLRDIPEGAAGLRPIKSPLTAREWEVVDLLAQRRSTEEMAHELVLATETVRSHVKNLMRKLGVRSREDAVAAAQRMRLGVGDHRPR
jgi:DNA-binding NarL/FixJ family response regulator